MPPIKEYIYKSKLDAQIEISIIAHDEEHAKMRLEYHVKNINNWYL